MELADGFRRSLLDRVGRAEQACQLPVGGDEHHRLPVGAHCFSVCLSRSRADAGVLHEAEIAEGYSGAVNPGPDALAGHGFKLFDG